MSPAPWSPKLGCKTAKPDGVAGAPQSLQRSKDPPSQCTQGLSSSCWWCCTWSGSVGLLLRDSTYLILFTVISFMKMIFILLVLSDLGLWNIFQFVCRSNPVNEWGIFMHYHCWSNCRIVAISKWKKNPFLTRLSFPESPPSTSRLLKREATFSINTIRGLCFFT